MTLSWLNMYVLRSKKIQPTTYSIPLPLKKDIVCRLNKSFPHELLAILSPITNPPAQHCLCAEAPDCREGPAQKTTGRLTSLYETLRLEALLEAIALSLEAIALRLEAMALGWRPSLLGWRPWL